MILHTLQASARALTRSTLYFVINSVGLTLGVMTALLIYVYVSYERSYDAFTPDNDRIYKVILERKYPDHTTWFSSVPPAFGKVMTDDFPEIEQATILGGTYDNIVLSYENENGERKSFKEDFVVAADSSFFSFFQIPLLKGNPETALAAPQQIVLTETTARRYFGNDDPIGKVIGGDYRDLKVTGVMKDLPANSHLKFDLLMSAETFPILQSPNFIRFFGHIYLKLHQGSDASGLQAKFPAMVEKYAAPQIENQFGQRWSDYIKAGNNYTYSLQPLRSIHLDERELEETFTSRGSGQMLSLLTMMGVLIIVFAAVNFINLTIVKSAERAQEAAVRKVLGSSRRLLMLQILGSSVMFLFIATVFAFILAQLFLPSLNSLVQKNLAIPYSVGFFCYVLMFILLLGIAAGCYPAWQFSGTPSLEALKGNYMASSKGQRLRNSLVILQIAFSSGILMLSLIVHTQTDFLVTKELGFEKNNVLAVQRTGTLQNNMDAFKNSLEQLPGVERVSNTSRIPGERSNYIGEQYQISASSEVLTAKGMVADDFLFETIGLNVVQGRAFSESTNDSLSLIINQAAAKLFAGTDPIGMKMTRQETNADGTTRHVQLTIVGVVEDFHFQPLQDEISPLVIRSSEYNPARPLNVLLLSIKDRPQEIITKAEAVWKRMLPDQPFVYTYLDKKLELEYDSYARLTKIFKLVTVLALVVSCLGLYGISATTGHLLRKEISVRKLLGATSWNISLVLMKKILVLVVIAYVLSVPVSYWVSNAWLENFAYRIPLTWVPFVVTFILIIAFALAAISVHAVKSALLKPLEVLRSKT